MKCKKIVLMSLVLSALCVVMIGCGNTHYAVKGSESSTTYLKNNMHYQDRVTHNRGSYANWTEPVTGHAFLPVNSIVEIEYQEDFFIVVDKNTGKKVTFEFAPANMTMTVDQYLKLITSSEPTPLQALSEIDRKGIADGKAYVGMTKDGVRIALGYPAAHKTPTLESNTWVYWRGRYGKREIDFDSAGKVTQIRTIT